MPEIRVVSAWIKRENGDRVWAVSEDYPNTPGGWSDVTGQQPDDIDAGQDTVVLFGRVSDEQLTALLADPRYPVIVNPESTDALTPEQAGSLQADLEGVYHKDVARLVADEAPTPAAVVETLVNVNTRPVWRPDMDVVGGDVLYFKRNLYEVIAGKDHTTQADWTPDRARSLFKRYRDSGTLEEWVQPEGAHDVYPMNWRVIDNGRIWRSLIDNNVWRPGSPGAESLWADEGPVTPEEPEPEPTIKEWVSGEQGLQIGDLRSWQGIVYRVRQSPGANIWQPPTVPALWEAV